MAAREYERRNENLMSQKKFQRGVSNIGEAPSSNERVQERSEGREKRRARRKKEDLGSNDHEKFDASVDKEVKQDRNTRHQKKVIGKSSLPCLRGQSPHKL